MAAADDKTLAALRRLLRDSHLAGPDRLPAMVTAAGQELGADAARLFLVDYSQELLTAVDERSQPGETRVSVAGTLAGRAYAEISQFTTTADGRVTLWTPVVDGTDRLGVLRLDYSDSGLVDDKMRAGCVDVAGLLAELVVTRSLYGDATEQVRRTGDVTIAAELQRRLLPPLTFVSSQVSIAAVFAPAEQVAGDSFDYAMNGATLHVAILDAMGHGLRSALLSATALAALRNSRRKREPFDTTARTIDTAIASQFGPGQFVTAIIGELDVRSGWWHWLTFGHPPALLVRAGQVVKLLNSDIAPPLGLGLLAGHGLRVGKERLEPGDRLALYTDGVTEARADDGEFFGIDRLVDLTCRHEAAGRPVAETLRRLSRAILDHQDGVLQDDATAVLVEWPTRRSRDAYP